MKHLTLITILLFFGGVAKSQFHTLTMPQPSPPVLEQQRIGVTQIEIAYNSPSVRGRDIWNDPNTIPQKGEPIPWRAGANENTTISFSDDVMIEGQKLEAGKYGFHIIPDGHNHTLLFASVNNYWGSYYLDVDKDVALKVEVKDTSAVFSEHLNFEFTNRTSNSVQIALVWGDRKIPFTVEVNLIETTVTKLRYELNGENTYQWEAWNDAAAWCLDHDTNLEEALAWVERSIGGGYGGFSANKNLTNISTKVRLLHKLQQEQELNELLKEAQNMHYSVDEAHFFSSSLLQIAMDKEAASFIEGGLKTYQDDWVLQYFGAVAYYYQKDTDKMNDYIAACTKSCPQGFVPRLESVAEQMKAGTYQYRGRG